MKLEINSEEHKLIRDAGLTLDGVLVLLQHANGVRVTEEMLGTANLLRKKGFLDIGITIKGGDLLNKLFVEQPVDAPPPISKVDVMTPFAGELHAALQGRLLELIGKIQRKVGDKEQYSFLCNKVDLEKKLRDVWKKYGPFEHDKVKKLLMQYVTRCHRANWNKVMLVQYYIMKDGTSSMWTDLESVDEQNEQMEVKKLAVDPKSLF